MARIALVVAAVAAWLWFSRRRRAGDQHVPTVPAAPTPPPPASVPTDDGVHDVAREDAPRDERTRLDASAGWADEPARPGSDRSLLAPPGPTGDETLGVPSWDRPV